MSLLLGLLHILLLLGSSSSGGGSSLLLLLLSIPSLLLLERRHGRGHWCSGSRHLARRLLLWRSLLLRRGRLSSRLLLRGHRRRWRLLIALLWRLLRWRLAVECHWRLLLWWRRLRSLLHPRWHSVAGWCQAAQWAHSRHFNSIRLFYFNRSFTLVFI